MNTFNEIYIFYNYQILKLLFRVDKSNRPKTLNELPDVEQIGHSTSPVAAKQ
jgi:hypothetical protein